MPKINKIKLSGTSYDIQDSNASKTVTLTQAQYDALQTKDPNTFYIISDGETFDPSEKVDTSAFTAYSASVETALSGKQDTLIPGENITISGNVISAEGGSSITIDPSLDTGSTNAVANSAITTAINDRATKSQAVGLYQFGETSGKPYITFKMVNSALSLNSIYYPRINGKGILTNNGTWAGNNLMFSLVETSAITTSVTSSSTDAQVPSAKAVYDAIQEGGGGGITSGEVQSMIDESISGKTDESAFTAHTADTTIHVTSSDKTTWSGKQDALVSGTNIKTINNESILGSGNITIQGGGGSSVVELTQAQYDALTTIDPDTIYVITDAAGGDLSNYYTKAQINAMIGDIESLLAAI